MRPSLHPPRSHRFVGMATWRSRVAITLYFKGLQVVYTYGYGLVITTLNLQIRKEAPCPLLQSVTLHTRPFASRRGHTHAHTLENSMEGVAQRWFLAASSLNLRPDVAVALTAYLYMQTHGVIGMFPGLAFLSVLCQGIFKWVFDECS